MDGFYYLLLPEINRPGEINIVDGFYNLLLPERNRPGEINIVDGFYNLLLPERNRPGEITLWMGSITYYSQRSTGQVRLHRGWVLKLAPREKQAR